MLKKILIPVLIVLLVAGAGAWYLFSVYSADVMSATEVVNVAEGQQAYPIRFADAEGNPVSGVMAKVCDEASCTMITSDGEGVFNFVGEKKAWTVQILTAPEGYAFDAEAVYPLSEESETVIVVDKE